MIACIGGAHYDRRGQLDAPSIPGTSNPGKMRMDFGGVARNVACNLARLGCGVAMVSRVGADAAGREVCENLAAVGIHTAGVTVSAARPTASYTAILEPGGQLVIGVADMEIYEEMTPAVLQPALPALQECRLWFADANLPAATLAWVLDRAGGIPVAVDAISVAKSRRLVDLLPRISVLFCNREQAVVMAGLADPRPSASAAARGLMASGARAGVVSAEAHGIAVWEHGHVQAMRAAAAQPRDVTGGGDALAAGTLYGLANGETLAQATGGWGRAAAAVTVESEFSAVPDLTRAMLEARRG